MKLEATIVWFTRDLRLDDHPALEAALRNGGPVIPVYIHAPESEGAWPAGAASRWWLHHSLAALERDLRGRGSRLILRAGDPLAELEKLARQTQAGAVYWSSHREPAAVTRDQRVLNGLNQAGIRTEIFGGYLLLEPDTLRTGAGQPYRVFTPFWRAVKLRLSAADWTGWTTPVKFNAPESWPESLRLEQLELLPQFDWAAGLRAAWTPGEAGAKARLEEFIINALADYSTGRERPDRAGTSMLSPHLHFGEISVRRLWKNLSETSAEYPPKGGTPKRGAAYPPEGGTLERGVEAFLRQLAWREFAYHLLHHFPQTPAAPLRAEFAHFPWTDDPAALRAWQRGRTGIPLVDAGMRQLWTTGWMHNRVRMIAASFLVKNLMIPWTAGAQWFWETLVDADLANNTLGWQWVAGCGADAAPFFRIFNAALQGEKFDPQGDYVRCWVPELARIPAAWIHRPHEAPTEILKTAGVALGENYPRPITDPVASRRDALLAFARFKKT